MQMGIAIAILTAAAALALAVWVVVLRRRQRALVEDNERFHQSLQRLEAQQGDLDCRIGQITLGSIAGDFARELESPLGHLKHTIERASDQVETCRHLVHAYDEAVEYCLQPVELILGADGDSLERLLKHVSEARRRLFSARTALLESHLLNEVETDFHDSDRDLRRASALVSSLQRISGTTAAMSQGVDVNEQLDSALTLVRMHAGPAVRVIKRMEALPSLPTAPWLGRALLQLSLLAAEAIADGGNLFARTRRVGQRIEVHIIGHAADREDAGPVTAQASQDPAENDVQSLQRLLYAHGASLESIPRSSLGRGFIVGLPLRATLAAAA